MTKSDQLYRFFIAIAVVCMLLQLYTVLVTFYKIETGFMKDTISSMELDLNISLHHYIFTRDISGIDYPTTILIYAMMAYTAVYGGSESIVSIIKIKDSGNKFNIKALPPQHRKKVLGAMKVWAFFGLVSTFLYLIIGENKIQDFNLKQIYSGFCISFVTLVSSDKAIKIGAARNKEIIDNDENNKIECEMEN